MTYLKWKEQTITDFSEKNISGQYDAGFVFTRIDHGVMHQTRSARIDLTKFELSSENRRILKRVEGLALSEEKIPYTKYSWEIGKLAKDFYESRNANFSANKVKALVTSIESNFNLLLKFSDSAYVICYKNNEMLHYSYPFYNGTKDMGLGMMIATIVWAKENGLTYVYLGSLQRPGDVYKLQFSGMEWFDGEEWSGDLEGVKRILTS